MVCCVRRVVVVKSVYCRVLSFYVIVIPSRECAE